MTTDHDLRLAQLFPTPEAISAEYRVPAPVDQRAYLVAGELRLWEEPCKTVLSPVCERDPATGEVKQIEIRSYRAARC